MGRLFTREALLDVGGLAMCLGLVLGLGFLLLGKAPTTVTIALAVIFVCVRWLGHFGKGE